MTSGAANAELTKHDQVADEATQQAPASGVAEVISLAHARACKPASSSPTPTSEEQLARYAELVREVELADGKPLAGPGRSDCLAAFRSYPLGFAAAVDEATQAHVDSHRGLLVSLIRSDWHVNADKIAIARQAREEGRDERLRIYDSGL